MRKLLYVGLMMIMLLSAPESKAQEEVGIVELHVEALAGGATFTFPAGSEWSLGVDFSAGKHLGVDVLEVDDDIDLFGVGYAVVSWRPDPSWQVPRRSAMSRSGRSGGACGRALGPTAPCAV